MFALALGDIYSYTIVSRTIVLVFPALTFAVARALNLICMVTHSYRSLAEKISRVYNLVHNIMFMIDRATFQSLEQLIVHDATKPSFSVRAHIGVWGTRLERQHVHYEAHFARNENCAIQNRVGRTLLPMLIAVT